MKNRSLDLKTMYNDKYMKESQSGHPFFTRQFKYLLKWTGKENGILKVLDLGGGTGTYSSIIQEMGHDVTLVDLSEVAVSKARSIGVKNAVCADFLSAPPNDTFDVILVKGFSPLNTDDPMIFENILSSIARLLSPGGVIFYYWGSADMSGQWTSSGWYNWHPSLLRNFFEQVQVCPAFRYQALLPPFINTAISRIVETGVLPKRAMTCIAFLRERSQ